MTRFDNFMKQAGKKQLSPDTQDQMSEHLNVQTSKRPDSQKDSESVSQGQMFEHSDVQTSKTKNNSTSKAKSSSAQYVRTTVYLTKRLHRRLKMGSLEHGLEMSDIAEQAIAQWLDEQSSR